MFSKFSEEAQKVLLMTKKEMQELMHPYVGSEHLLLAILHNKNLDITKFLEECGLSYEKCKKEIISVIGIGKSKNDWFLYTPLLKRVIENAILECRDTDSVVSVEGLFVSLLEEGEGVANRILMGMNVDLDCLYEKFSNLFVVKNGKTIRKLCVEEFALDLNKKYNVSGFDPVVGRDDLVNRLMEILLRRTKNNPLLIGEAGVGKTAIVEEFVRRIELGSVPKKLFGKSVLCLSMASLVAGTKYRGEFEERINQIVEELENEPNIILFIDEIHTLVGAGGAEGAIDASNILKPYLARGKIRIIGATTKDEYNKYIENDKALDRRFQKVFVRETTLAETENILTNLKDVYEKYHDVIVSDEIIKEIIRLTDRYVYNGRFPDKAIDIFDEVCAKASVMDNSCDKKIRTYLCNIKKLKDEKNKAIIDHDFRKASELKEQILNLDKEYNEFLHKKNNVYKKRIVTKDILYKIISDRTKIPVSYIKGVSYKKVILDLKRKVFGQDDIIEKVVKSSLKNSLVSKSVPSSFLFVGKSGVGKTFFVKEYAKLLYNEESFIRLDMSEYSDSFSSSKIIGSPPGYVGYGDSKNLLDKIRYNPYSVLLLDEIEKANPSIMKLFLQVFDEGVMTDSRGNKVDFRHVVIFMTSNLGTEKMSIGFSEKNDVVIFDKIKSFLGVELFNRIDDVLIFNDISENVFRKIVESKLTNMIEKKNISIKNFAELVNKIVKDVNYELSGARKIDKIIEMALNDLIFLET